MRRALLAVALVGCSSPSEEQSAPADTAVVIVEDSATDTYVATDTAPDTAVDTSTLADTSTCGCASYTDPAEVGTIGGTAIDELSGLAVSRAHPGVLWAHNDSGDTPRVFAASDKGAFLGQITIGGATAIDWEDMALGPCPKGTCLYIADFGDNGMSRTNLALYRITEPNVDNKPFATITADAEKLPFAYPDGRFNAEALLVHPVTGEIVVVTKGATTGIYRFPTPLTPGVTATLVRVGAVTGLDGVVTGGDVSPCGDRALLRTYASLYEFRGATIGDALVTMGVRVPVATEGQGEAVAYHADGRGYFTASEGASVPLYSTACR